MWGSEFARTTKMLQKGPIFERELNWRATGKPLLFSSLETVTIASTDRHVEYVDAGHFEAPNWTRDGSFCSSISDGTLTGWRSTAQPAVVPTGPQNRCNNDHGISPDGEWLAISDRRGRSQIAVYVVPWGGTPQLVTQNAPSYWHGWSPDGNTLAFTGQRDGSSTFTRSPRRRRRDAADHGEGPGRRAGVFAGWEVHLLQLGAQRACKSGG